MENKQKFILAAFDFDGTITKKDTLFQFLIHCFGWPGFLFGLVKFIPTGIQYFLKIIDNNLAKERLFCIFFKNMPFEKFQEFGTTFSKKIINIINNQAIDKINWHKKEGHKLIIISASIKNWIEPWAKENGFEFVLSTEVAVEKGILTGSFSNKNCIGNEKVARLLMEYPNRNAYQLYAYGDSNGDTALIQEADFAFYRKF
jgi:phosphatidylglycerophosphatase C